MTWHVHNYHTPAIEVDEEGNATHNGTYRISLPAPIFTAETREEAEAWRVEGYTKPE